MNAQTLALLLDDWKTTSRAEEAAIALNQWAEVDRQQLRKQALRQQILHTTEAWQRRWSVTGETQADYERAFRPILAELIALENSNGALLARQREQASRQMQELDRTTQTLRGVQRAYGATPQTQWTSYS